MRLNKVLVWRLSETTANEVNLQSALSVPWSQDCTVACQAWSLQTTHTQGIRVSCTHRIHSLLA